MEVNVGHCWAKTLSKYSPFINLVKSFIDHEKNYYKNIIEVYMKDSSQIVKAVNELKSLKYIYDVKVLSTHNNFFLLEIVQGICPLHDVLKSFSDTFVREDINIDGSIILNINIKKKKVDILLKELEKFDDIAIKNIKILRECRTPLTKKQEMIIKAAIKAGYYDFPRRITLRELAKIFDISTATLCELLRRCESNIIKYFFNSTDKFFLDHTKILQFLSNFEYSLLDICKNVDKKEKIINLSERYIDNFTNIYQDLVKLHHLIEEEIIFPSISAINGRYNKLVKELIRDHKLIEFKIKLIKLMKSDTHPKELIEALKDLIKTIKRHIHLENEVYGKFIKESNREYIAEVMLKIEELLKTFMN